MTARFAKIPEAFLRDTRLTLRDHRVYAALRLFADGNGKACFPSRERIAEAAGFTIKTEGGETIPHVTKVSAITARLVRFGWIKKVGKGGRLAGHQGKHVAYTLLDMPESTVPDSGTPTVPESGASTVPKSGMVNESTVPKSGISTVPKSGSRNCPFSQSASSFPPTYQTIDQTLKKITDHEARATALDAANAACPPQFFQDQNPKTNEPQPAATMEPVAVSKRGKGKRGTRLTFEELPDDWQAWAESFAEQNNTGDLLRVESAWLKFRDFWKAKPGAGGKKLDWFATWKNWLRSDLESLQRRPSTRKLLEENRVATARLKAERADMARRQAEAVQQQAERERKEAQRRAELAPLAERVKAYLAEAQHGLAARDVANAVDATDAEIESVYRVLLSKDRDVICCSPALNPTGEWIARTVYESRSESPPPTPSPSTQKSPPPTPSAPKCSPADMELAYDTIVSVGERGIDLKDLPSEIRPSALNALRADGRVVLANNVLTAAQFRKHRTLSRVIQ